jgi:AraC-like DNA-binding protein
VACAQRIVRGPLSPYIESLWLSEGYAQPHAREHVLPTGCMDLVMRLDGGGRSSGVISGARSRSIVLDTSEPLSVIGVRFKPGGGAPFIRLPAGELQDTSVAPDDLWRDGAARLREQLFEAETSQGKLQTLERFLLARLQGAGHAAVDYAVTQFQRSPTVVSVATVVERTGLSPRRFIAAFRDQVGLTPKVFARLCRFRRAIQVLQGRSQVDWVDTAVSCGYFDQSHFIHDFRAFSGMSPSRYLRNRTGALNHVRCPD